MYIRVFLIETNESEGVYLECAKWKGGGRGVIAGARVHRGIFAIKSYFIIYIIKGLFLLVSQI